MNHLNNLKGHLIKEKKVHTLSKEEYEKEVFIEKGKVTCQFIGLTILSAIFAGIFYAFQNIQHTPQVAGDAATTGAK